jgi:glutathione S-transferase
MDVTLYYAPITCALVPYVTLTEANARFDVRPINLRRKQQMSPEYLRLNPKHKVPVLVVDGRPLTENVAIQVWIARNFPEADLLPSDPWQQAQAISLLAWFAAGMHPHLSRINSPAKFCGQPSAEQSVRDIAVKQFFEYLQIADEKLAGREFFFDHFTAPDAHFFWCFRRGLQFDLDQSGFANCMAHFERMKTRPSVQKVLAFEKDVRTEFAKVA